jgi:hypothetical protein
MLRRSDLPHILANLVPLVGVLFFGWNAWWLLALYWIENAAVWVLTTAKILFSTSGVETRTKCLIAAVFAGFYGFFLFIHGVFVFAFGQVFGERGELLEVFQHPWMAWFGVLSLVGGLAYQFVEGYLIRGEGRDRPLQAIAEHAGPRMIVLHLTLIFGGWVLLALGSPVGLVAVMVLLKTAAEVFFARLAAAAEPAVATTAEVG